MMMNGNGVNKMSEEVEQFVRNASRIKSHLKNYILRSYDADEIHEACEAAGHSTCWESFDVELDSYAISDMLNLLEQMEEL